MLLGTILHAQGQIEQAVLAQQRAIALDPNYAEAYDSLGNALASSGQFDDAVAAFRRAIALKPDYAEAHSNLGGALRDQWQLDEAIAVYRQAIAAKPDYAPVHSNLLLALHYHPDLGANVIAEEHHRWNARHAGPLKQFIRTHGNQPDPDRRLRIGYVSGELCSRPVGRFVLPLLTQHDQADFEIHCYSEVRKPDDITARLKRHSGHWHETAGMSDETLAEQIRRDGIDILIDLSMHIGNNRLLVFARKPAPVQATWLSYASTTGLSAIDYRLSDPYLDPPGETEHYAEQTIRIPSYWCYQPLESPPIAAPPGDGAGSITFGCLNNFCKVSPTTLTLWCEVLRKVERSRLLIHSLPGSHRQTTLRVFADAGIDPSRIGFVGYVPLETYLLQYQQIDIALDTTPFAGGTTTCDALWMGVPTVTLSGRTAVGRGGVSLLSNLGLTELIARTPEQYTQIAVELANDLPSLKELRSTLRRRMERSPLMDAPRFARNIEAAYRQMWQTWCATAAKS
jgi:predicted O-linked N-acetylglucosamine transferase (SPINDLY family)